MDLLPLFRLAAGFALLLGSLPPVPLGAAENSGPRVPGTSAAASAPAIEGSLPNGLRYTLLPHRRDLGRVSVRLVVHAGSLDERDNERGYAHFVEHMAFNGSRHYPPGKLREFFQSLGLADGADLNAHTGFTHTTYKIDLPTGRVAQLGDALQVLRDFADGVEFPAAEVRRERGVVLSEAAARDTEDQRITEQRLAALYAGTLIPARHPIGVAATLNRATAGSLRAFYRRCYAPARMALVVGGDFETDAVKKLLVDHFGSLRADRSAVAQVIPALPAPAGKLQARFISAPNAIATDVSLALVDRPDLAASAGYEESLLKTIATDALSRRLKDRRARESQRFGRAHAFAATGADVRFMQFGLEAYAATDDWEAAVRLVETELRRARERGFTDEEVGEQLATRVAWLRAGVDTFASEPPSDVATAIATAIAGGNRWRHPAALFADAEQFVSKFTATAATAALRSLFTEDRLHLQVSRTAQPAGGEAAILAVYHASAARPLEPEPPAPAPLKFRYENFGTAGTVAQRRTEADLGIELVTFANGARLNLRASPTEPRRFRLVARLGRGVPDLPRDQPGLPHLAAHFLKESDLGRHSREELARLLGLHAIRFHATFDHSYLVEVQGPAAELPFALKLIAAEFSDPKLDPLRLSNGLSGYGACRASRLDDAPSLALRESLIQMTDGDQRMREPPPDEVSRYTFGEVTAWIRTHWLGGPLEIGIAGDFDPAVAITAAAASVGALPVRREAPPAAGDRLALRPTPSQEIRRESLADQTAAVRLSWPAGDAGAEDQHAALSLACDVLVDRLHHTLRQELGSTYSPQGGLFTADHASPVTVAAVALTFAPDRASDFAARAIAIADKLARDGATAEEFTRLREPFLARLAERIRDNESWLDEVLAHAQSAPATLARVRAFAARTPLTREDVNRAAAAFLTADRASSLIIIPVAPTPTPAEVEPATSADFVQRAIARTGRGDLDGALADFERAIALDPKNDDAYVNRSAVKMARGDLDGSMADCTQAIALNPKNALAYANRGGAKVYLGAADGAIADCTKALELNPALALAHGNRAGARFARGDLDGCIADATKAIELDPKNAMAYVNRGAARGNKGEIDGAIADSTKAIENDPRNADGYNNRAYMRQLKGELDAALPDFDRAIELNPRSVNSYRNRGIIHQTKGRNDAALADYDKTIELSPDDVVARIHRGMIRQQKGDHDGAIADYDHSIRLDPKNADAFNNRGYTKQLKGDLDGAIADFTVAIELRPDFAVAYNNRGQAKRLKGDRFGAIDDLDRGSRISAPVRPASTTAAASAGTPTAPAPSPALALIRSGDAKRTNRNRNLDGALADYEKALQQDPSAAEAFVGRALVRAARNDATGALADLDNAIALQPTLAAAYLERGNVRRNQREFPRALTDYNKAIELAPRSAPAYYGRGSVRESQSNHAAAFADFDMAITINPAYVPAYNGRGHARQMQGDYDRAILDYNEALKRSANYTPALFNRGFVLQATGKFTAALADYDKLIGLSPRYLSAHANRANVRHALGDFAGAIADYDQATILAAPNANYAPLFRWVAERRLERADVTAKLSQASSAWQTGSMKTIARFLVGELSETELFAAGRGAGGRATPIQVCEWNYFAGMKHLLENDSAGARALLEKSLAANQTGRLAHILARAELARLTGR